MKGLLIGAALLATLGCSDDALAMSMQVVGDQIILSGESQAGDYERFKARLDANAGKITTIILRDAPGGDVMSAYSIAALIRAQGLRTAVSGYCVSACTFAFMGGVERQFAAEKAAGLTFLMFHGTYNLTKGLMTGHYDAQDTVLTVTGGRADPALFNRIRELVTPAGGLYFLHSDRYSIDGASVFICIGGETNKVADCERIPGTNVFKQGILTSRELVQVNGAASAEKLASLEVAGDQIILAGNIREGDDEKLTRLLDQHRHIRTLILRNLFRGDFKTARALAAVARERNLRTAVSGYCKDACAYLFLSGTERQMTDDRPAGRTFISFSLESEDGEVKPATFDNWLQWTAERTEGKADAALLSRLKDARHINAYVYFLHPDRFSIGGASVFFCRGPERRQVDDCEKIPGTNALVQQILTSKTLVKVHPAPAAPTAAAAQ